MQPLALHEDPFADICYIIKLTASILSMPTEIRTYHIASGDARSPDFLQDISSIGKIPISADRTVDLSS